MKTKVPAAAANDNRTNIEMRHREQHRDAVDDNDLRSLPACGVLFLDRDDAAAMFSVSTFHTHTLTDFQILLTTTATTSV